jgi:hypothetical protein
MANWPLRAMLHLKVASCPRTFTAMAYSRRPAQTGHGTTCHEHQRGFPSLHSVSSNHSVQLRLRHDTATARPRIFLFFPLVRNLLYFVFSGFGQGYERYTYIHYLIFINVADVRFDCTRFLLPYESFLTRRNLASSTIWVSCGDSLPATQETKSNKNYCILYLATKKDAYDEDHGKL